MNTFAAIAVPESDSFVFNLLVWGIVTVGVSMGTALGILWRYVVKSNREARQDRRTELEERQVMHAEAIKAQEKAIEVVEKHTAAVEAVADAVDRLPSTMELIIKALK